MSQMSELAITIEELRKTAQMLIGVADSLTEMFSTTDTESITDYEEICASEPVTFEELRGKLAEISRSGHTDDVKAILHKYGAEKLSALSKENYESVLLEAMQYAN